MNFKLQPEFPVTDAACKDATGKTLQQWFAELDVRNALKDGRRQTSMYLMGLGVPEWWMTTIAVEYERHAGQPKKDGLYEGYGICSTRTLNAPLADAYAAWLDAGSLGQWFGAGATADVTEGGRYSTKDGDAGGYLRIREHKDLRFTWENPAFSSASLVDVVFTDKGGGRSHIMLNHSRIQTRAEADALRAGWSTALSKLKALLEG